MWSSNIVLEIEHESVVSTKTTSYIIRDMFRNDN